MQIQASRIDHIQINISDLQRAKNFYENVLQMKEVARPESFDFVGAWYRIGEVDLHLVVREKEPLSQRHFCLWVENVKGVAEFLQSQGLAVRWDLKYKITGVDRFFVFDPDENRIEIQGADGTGNSRWEKK